MDENSVIKEYIEVVLNTAGFAVLATEGNGQPHTSLIASTYQVVHGIDDIRWITADKLDFA